MPRRLVQAIALVAGVLLPVRAAVEPPPPWSERGVFVFGYILFDFKYNVEAQGAGPHAPLINCSTPELYCAHAHVLHLVLPRACSGLDAGRWSANGITTEMLYKGAEPEAARGIHAFGSGTILLLGSPEFPDVVYEYDPGLGVRAIYYVWHTDLVSLARQGRDALKPYRAINQYNWLVTADLFGQCDAK